MKPPSAKSCPACGERYEGDVLFCSKDGTPLASSRSASFQSAEGDPYVGVELAGHIRIKHLIGIGSMGRVYRAFQAGIERDVAVKILHRELSGNGELVARFHREAKVASRLVHPNVVQVLMTGTVPFRDSRDVTQSLPRGGGEMYLVMEHLDGISLLSALAAAGNTGDTAALPLPRALHIVLQLCDAVGEAHAQGIVHRDLKPENVMLIRRGEDPDYVKVLDFGIARIDWANQSMATQAGLIFGTAKYISPEGAAGEGVGPQADVYSIATILYQCLAGRAPFEDESPVALLVQHTHAVPPELRSIPRASYVPAPIADVVMTNLAKKPSARAQDARAFGRELVAAMRASGLDPDEIIAHSTLIVRGAVRLASHARTKSMDMTPELAAVIAHASKASPLPAPPPLAPTNALRTPVPTPAILVGVRPTDTMVVDASELIDASPPPLPVPPPAALVEEPVALAEAGSERAEGARGDTIQGDMVHGDATPGGGAASGDAVTSEAAATEAAPSQAAPAEGATVEAATVEAAAEQAASEPAEAVAAALVDAATEAPAGATGAAATTDAGGSVEASARPGPSQNTESEAVATSDRVSCVSSTAPVAVPVQPPPSLRTLFDAPAPEAMTSPPASVAEGALLPVAPERPGGTQVGPSPFDGDSIDTSIPPLPSRPSTPGALPIQAPPPASLAAPRAADLDWSDDAKPAAAFHSTMQGTAVESAPAPQLRKRSRAGRVVAILAIAAAAAGAAIVFGRYLGDASSAAESSDSLDELVEQARECARTRSWDSPPGANVRDITARALEQAPGDKRILEIRKESAEKIVTEALGRKYAGNRDDAQRLARVALELDPALTTAQHLVAEIEADLQAESAAAAASASASATAAIDAKPGTPAASGTGAPPKSSAKAQLPAASALPPSKGSPSAVAPAKTGKPSAPPPKNTSGPAVLPQPTSTGPWL